MGTRVKVTWIAINQFNKPVLSASEFEDLQKGLDDYVGADERGLAISKGFHPWVTKYPDDYEGYFEYELMEGNYIKEEDNIEKFYIYCIEFFPHTIYEV